MMETQEQIQEQAVEWYYAMSNQQHGPVTAEQLTGMISRREISQATRLWRAGMADWLPASQTELAPLFQVNAPPPLAAQPAPNMPPPMGSPAPYPPYAPVRPGTPSESLRKTWLWVAILVGAGFPLSFIVIGLPVFIAGLVFWFMLMHKCWSAIQDGYARTTPGKAVGFHFIPFFNFYWIFFVNTGLAKDLNRYCAERNINVKPMDETLPLIYCILSVCCIVPFLGILSAIGSVVLMILVGKEYARVTGAILDAKAGLNN